MISQINSIANFQAALYFKPMEKQSLFGIVAFDKPCPDQIVGKYNLNENKYIGIRRSNIEYFVENGAKKSNIGSVKKPLLVVLLESPHIDEFDSITGMGIGPAMGKTGENFSRFFESVFVSGIDTVKKYNAGICEFNVAFVNADQYQCSLGISPLDTKVRDENFKINFEKNKGDMIMRIAALNPDILINCVTSGLKSLVNDEIIKNCDCFRFLYFNSTHPSSWYYPNNRKIKFVNCF